MSSYDFSDDGTAPTSRAPLKQSLDRPLKAVFTKQPVGGRSLAEFYANSKGKAVKDAPEAGSGLDGVTERGTEPSGRMTAPASSSSTSDLSHLAHVVGFDNEAAKLLRQLYGQPKPSAPPPKPKTAPWHASGSWRRPMHAEEAADPRDSHVDKEAQKLLEATRPPAKPIKEVHVAPIERLEGRKKSAAQIAMEIAKKAATEDIVMPPFRRGYNTDLEKRKLQTLFAFKGGKTLPDVAMPEAVQGQIPLQLLTGKRRAHTATTRSVHDVSSSFGLDAREEKLLAAATKDELRLLGECHATSESLLDSIAETRAYAEELKQLGSLDAVKQAEVQSDIIAKQDELVRLRQLVADVRHRLVERTAHASMALHHESTTSLSPRSIDELPEEPGFIDVARFVQSTQPTALQSAGMRAVKSADSATRGAPHRGVAGTARDGVGRGGVL